MATTGSIDFNISKIGEIVNNSMTFADMTMHGISGQGNLIGTATGITIAVGLFISLVFLALLFLPKMLKGIKQIKSA